MTTPTPKHDRPFAALFSRLAWALALALLLIFISYNELMADRLPLVTP